MNNCTPLGLANSSQCREFSVSGIKKLYVVPFGSFYDYTYTDDNLGVVTGFKSTLAPVEYKILDGQFSERYLYEGSVRYVHNLTFTFGKMDYTKRNEFESLIGNRITVVFEDKNGKCWITGQDFALRPTGFEPTTGGESNQYVITYEGRALNQVREVTCISSGCFASFDGSELRQSTFTIENASLFDFSGDWEMIADTLLLSYTPAQALDPTDWSTPATLAQDLAELTNFVSNANTSVSLSYNGGTDTAYIQFLSTDTTYDYLVFNGGVINRSTVKIVVNLNSVLSTNLNNPSTTITVTDDTLAVVYSGAPTDSIGTVPANVYGTVTNAYVVVSELYPNGTTFTVSIDNPGCDVQVYTYTSEKLANCDVETGCSYYLGYTYTGDVTKSIYFEEYRKLILRFDEYHFPIITGAGDETSTFATVAGKIIAQLSTCPLIEPASISVVDNTTYITISFVSKRNNGVFTMEYIEDVNDLVYTVGTQSSLMNLEVYAISGSTIELLDSSLTELSGAYGQAPFVNTGYNLEDIPNVTTGNIENLAFDVNAYPETEAFTLTVDNSNCPSTTFAYDTAVCYDATDLSITTRYEKYKLDVSGELIPNLGYNFGFVYEYTTYTAAVPITLTTDLVGYQSSKEFVDKINDIIPVLPSGNKAFRVIKYTFDAATWTYYLELEVDNDVIINDIEVDDLATVFTLVDTADITYVTASETMMNPHTGFKWEFDDIDAVTFNVTQEGYTVINRNRDETTNSYQIQYISGSNTLDMTIAVANPDGVTFNFYDSSFVLQESFSVGAGVFFSNQAVTTAIATVAYVTVENNYGLSAVITFDSTTQSDIILPIDTYQSFKNFWGRFDHWQALTPAVFVPSPVVYSVLCP